MSTIKRWRQSVAVLAAMLLGVAGQAQAQHGSDKNGPVVQTSEGPVRGFVNNGVYHFLGIPYAAPPVGAWRWRPPQPPKTRKALLDATAYGNICPQATDRKSTRLNSSHEWISYAVFCLKKKNKTTNQ